MISVQPDTLATILSEINRRLGRLEQANPLDNASIAAGKLSVTDLAGTVRVEMGNLAARGNSPAQLGIRGNDATGAPLWDAVGLLGVMSQPTAAIHLGASQVFTTASDVTYTGTSMNWTLARAATMFYIGRLEGIPQGGSIVGNGSLYVDGFRDITNANTVSFVGAGTDHGEMLILSKLFAAGAHTIAVACNNGSAPTGQFTAVGMDSWLFQLGG